MPQEPSLDEPPLLDFAGHALFLDFDGTLVELCDTPDGIHVPDSLIETLHALSERLEGRLALVSGRAIEVLDGFGMSQLAAAGSHGSEWRLAGGEREYHDRPVGLDAAQERFSAFAKTEDGLLFEDKPLGAALHYRRAPSAEEAAHALARELADQHDLHLQRGHDMVELRLAGVDKGTAIARLLQQEPFLGHSPVFVGDDVTDEDGFRAVHAAGGIGVLVGAPRETRARYRLAGVDAVNDWLVRSLENGAAKEKSKKTGELP